MKRLLLSIGAAVSLICHLSAEASYAQFPPSSYTTIIEGNVPIILTAPHGGTLSYPFAPRSCTGTQVCGGDTNTRLLAQRVSDEFFAMTGLRPYTVMALGDRFYIDLNRDKSAVPNDAYENPLAEPYYDYYHDSIQGIIDEVKETYGRGLLIDIHGQSSLPDSVLRGTKNGLTTTLLREEFGSDPTMNGVNSIFGSLDALGYPDDPDVSITFDSQVENPSYDGGFTVQNYGSQQSNGIDAIQIEYGINFRGTSGSTLWQQTGTDLAIALSNFYDAYLAQEPGDIDTNGTVNGADYLEWARGFGQSSGATITDGDANGDGIVDGNDLPIWQKHFGETTSVPAASQTAIPEPSAIALLLAGQTILCFRRTACKE